ncbi:MAG TPA: hypothetical protein VIO60_03520, partial [Rectinemataceae bacterium]
MRSKRIARIIVVALAIPVALSAAKAWTGLEPELRVKGRIPLVLIQSTVQPAESASPVAGGSGAANGGATAA